MKNVSKKFLETMQERRDFYAVAEITFASGVKKTISKNDLTVSGNSIYDGGGSSSFPLGLLIPRQINLSLDNHDDRWSEYDFYGAKISLKTVFDFDDDESEEINIGEYTVVTPESYGTVVGITAVDDSYKADKDYSTSLSFPASLGAALSDSCATCGIKLLTETFPNSNYMIQEKPQSITHRQFIGMCAMIAGGNAKFDEHNRLKIVPYDFSTFENISWIDGGTFAPWTKGESVDGGSFEPWTSGQNVDGGAFGDRDGIHILYQFAPGIKIEANDVVITGVQMESEDTEGNKTTHLFGKEGYVLSIENQLAKGKEDDALALIGAKIVGLRFRPFTGDHIALPTAESMDLAVIIDRKNNAYTTVLTDVDYTYFGFTSMKCTADSPIRNQSIYYGNETKAIVQARQMVEVEKTQRELAVEALAKQIAQNNGLYLTEERQTGGGSVFYLHNQPTVKESSIIWKLTADAIAVSTDYGKTYPVGIDATGVAILNKIYTIGLDADHITSGKVKTERLDVEGIFSKDVTATGTIRGVNLVGAKLETESGNRKMTAREANIIFYKKDKETGRIAPIAWGDIEENEGIMLATGSKYLALAYETERGTYGAGYILNNGLNPDEYTERNILYGSTRATGAFYFVNASGTGNMSVDGNISTENGNISTTNGNIHTPNGNISAGGFIASRGKAYIGNVNFGDDFLLHVDGKSYFANELIVSGNIDLKAHNLKNVTRVAFSDDIYFAKTQAGSNFHGNFSVVDGYLTTTGKILAGNVDYGDYILQAEGNAYISGSIKENGNLLSDKYAPKTHDHDFLPLTGGTLSGNLTVNGNVYLKSHSLYDVMRIYFTDAIYIAQTNTGVNFHGNFNVVGGNLVVENTIAEGGAWLSDKYASKADLGKIYNGTVMSKDTLAAWTENASVDLPAGTYVVSAHITMSGMGKALTIRIIAGSTEYGRGSVYAPDGNTYTASVTDMFTLSEETTVYLQTWSAKSALVQYDRYIVLKAMRIK